MSLTAGLYMPVHATDPLHDPGRTSPRATQPGSMRDTCMTQYDARQPVWPGITTPASPPPVLVLQQVVMRRIALGQHIVDQGGGADGRRIHERLV